MTRSILKFAILLAGLLAGVGQCALAADAYPSKPVRFIVPFAPGGSTDIVTRIVARRMGERLGQQVIVENRSGADGLIGTNFVKNEAADGYTVLAIANSFSLAPAVKRDPGYDPVKDFAPVGPMVRLPMFLVTSPQGTYHSVPELIARAKTTPMEYGVSAPSVRLQTEQFLRMVGVTNMINVPYKGSGPALPDVASGRVAMMFDGVPSSGALVKGGKLRALAITGSKRAPGFPDVPTLTEQGVDLTMGFWLGLLTRNGVPKDVISKLSDALRFALTDKELNERFVADGGDLTYMTPEGFAALIAKESADAVKLATELQLPKD